MKTINDLTFDELSHICILLNKGIENTSYSIEVQIKDTKKLFEGKVWKTGISNISPKSWYNTFKYIESLGIDLSKI